MNIYLVRHGQTAHNRDGLALGRADVPLTELGERQAAAVGNRFSRERVDRVFASPLIRARATALPIAEARGLEIETRDALTEMDVGHTEGMTFAAMRREHAAFLELWARDEGTSLRIPGGESLEDLARRLDPFLDELRSLSAERVVVVSHNFVVKIAVCRLLGLELSKFRSISVDLASVTTVELRNRRVFVHVSNDRCHLESLEH